MITTFLKHLVYDHCLTVMFNTIRKNFSKPSKLLEKAETRNISVIEVITETANATLRIVYTNVEILHSDDNGMEIFAEEGVMSEFPPLDDKVYINNNFQDYIFYEDIQEIIE